MAFDISLLWKAPEVNPITKKARSIPILNVVDPYGRVFFFSWMGFMLGFWAWYESDKSFASFLYILTLSS
jgi:NNP family nitrate/nitrite transporter-like MFS transporter